jgi:hypothetical protein
MKAFLRDLDEEVTKAMLAIKAARKAAGRIFE